MHRFAFRKNALQGRLAGLLFLALCVLAFPCPSLAGDPVVMAADVWCPFTCAPEAAKPGFMVEIAKYALEAKGHSLVYVARPWNRAIMEAEAGKLAGLIGAVRIELPNFIFPDCDLGSTKTVFYVRAGDPWRYTGVQSLAGKRIGVVEGYMYGEPLDTAIRERPTDFISSRGEEAVSVNLKALAAGRVDIAPEDPLVAATFATMTGQGRLFEPAGELEALEVSIAFPPDAPRSREFAADMCAGLKALRESGRLNAIMQAYSLGDWR